MFSGEIGRHDRNSLIETPIGTLVSKAETGADQACRFKSCLNNIPRIAQLDRATAF